MPCPSSEEVRGIAVGADQPLDVVLASQFMDEEWAYRGAAEQKCSSLAIRSSEGLTWLGQNMDLGQHTDGHQVVMRIAPHGSEPGALVFTIGGMVGLLGVNARAIGVCVNSLPQLPHAREGLPVAFVIRKLLQARTLAEAVEAVSTVPHSTGQHYLIAGPGWVRSFEASARGVVEYHAPDPERVLHTNHPLAQAGEGMSSSPYLANSFARLRSLTDRLMRGVPDLDAIQAALCASDDPEHPVCRLSATGAAALTTGSLITALETQSTTVDAWISAGPPSLRGYERVSLARA
jgi:isopenicillin-N N-acyltransferase like protein